MNQQDASFLYSVKQYVKDNPHVAAYVSDFVAKGLEETLNENRERASDMEVALAVAIEKRYKGREDLILSKLYKWKDRAALRWDRTIEMLEGVKK